MRARSLLFATTIVSLAAGAIAQDRPRGPRRESSPPAELKNFTFREE